MPLTHGELTRLAVSCCTDSDGKDVDIEEVVELAATLARCHETGQGRRKGKDRKVCWESKFESAL
jgi:hypothetical protein